MTMNSNKTAKSLGPGSTAWSGAWLQIGIDGEVASLATPKSQKRRRKTVQDRKDALRAELTLLCNKAPSWMSVAGLVATRNWVGEQKKALRTLKSAHSSVRRLQSAVSRMAGLASGAP
jgi:hypothetical protein